MHIKHSLKHFKYIYRLVIGQNQIIVNYVADHSSGTFEPCMIRNKLVYDSIIAGNLQDLHVPKQIYYTIRVLS